MNTYFENLAKSNTDFAHGQENKAFFREFSSARIMLDSDFHNNLSFCGKNILISQFNDDSQLPPPQNDFPREQATGAIYILTRIFDNDMEQARIKAIRLRDDIYAKIKKDTQENVFTKGLVFGQMSSQTIGRVADNFFGIVVFMSYNTRYSISYDALKWT